jgi:hypothetical protein
MGGNSVPEYVLTPEADAGKGRVSLDIIFDATVMSIVGGYQWSIWTVDGGYWDASPHSVLLCLSNAGQTQGAYEWQLSWAATAGGTHQAATLPWSPFRSVVAAGDYADLVDGQAHTVEVTWQCGTLTHWTSDADMTVASDGWIKLKVDGVTLIDEQSIPLVVNPDGLNADYSTPNLQANVNRWTTLDIGGWNGGLCGIYDNIIIGTPEEWVDIADYVTVELDSTEFVNGVATVRVATWAGTAGMPVEIRLQNVTDDTTVALGETVTSTTPVTQLFTATLSTGVKRYRLQVSAEDPAVDVFAMGQIQVPVVS